MTNEQAKQEAIKKAWIQAGFNWKQIKDKVLFDGCIELSSPALKYSLDGYKEAHSLGLLKGVSFNGDSLTVQLFTLNGINFNNGWTRIEPDGSNLPETSPARYKVYNDGSLYTLREPNKNNDDLLTCISLRMLYTKRLITHYKPIKEEPKPIY